MISKTKIVSPITKEEAIIKETKYKKALISSNYNYIFDKETGFFVRWGKTTNDDPQFSPFGPEILDLEVSVNGCPNNCGFCYKGNTNEPATNMSYETFVSILDKMPPTLTQIAFGITGLQTNPDFFRMMEYCKSKEIVPNFTLSGIDYTEELGEKIAKTCGAVAVSAYSTNKNICYNTVKSLTNKGMNQVNIHIMVSQETLPFVYEVLNDIQIDERLSNLNAVVFLGVKPKGRAESFRSLNKEESTILYDYCFNNKLRIGFDSCSAPKIMNYSKGKSIEKSITQVAEPCESSLFSSYISTDGTYHNCSFSEGKVVPVDVLNCKDFLSDVWYHPEVIKFRDQLLNNNRECPIYPEINIL